MTYTPVELRHVRVGRSLFGYNRAAVEQVIEEVAQSFEATWRERGELAERVELLEKQLDAHKQREDLLTQTLIAAEQAASDVRERARREADAIIAEAHNEARAIGRSAHAKREQLLAESQRIEAMLRSALGVVEEGTMRMPPTTLAPKPPVQAESVAAPAAPASAPSDGVIPVAEPAPIPALPPVIENAQAPPTDEWREDTREFAPIVSPEPEIEEHEPDPEPAIEASATERVLQSTPGRESRDFDWGE
jgi:cell division initiation protein